MTLEGSGNFAIIIFVLFMIIALVASYLYGWKMIETTGLFGSQTFVAGIMNLFLSTCAIFGWFLYSFEINEALFFGGLVLGSILFAVSEAALIITLFMRRYKLIEKYHEQMGSSVTEQE